MSKKLYIIDGHAHIYAAYYAPMRPEWPKHPASEYKSAFVNAPKLEASATLGVML
jgi:hypothetical protein